jgi:hypothetical protein
MKKSDLKIIIKEVIDKDVESRLEKNILLAKDELDRFDDNFEKGITKIHIHDYNHMRKNLVDELLLAKQRLSDFKKSK